VTPVEEVEGREVRDGPDRVDAAWLTDVLADAGALEGARVVGVRAEPVGTGQMGLTTRLHLTYDRLAPGAPATVVGKFPSADAVSRQTGAATRSYEREARFYEELAATVAVRVPHCWSVAFDPATHCFHLLLEDLAPRRQGDQLAGCSLEVARAALDQLVGLHAPRWADATLGSVEYLSRRSADGVRDLQALYQAVFSGFVDRYGHGLAAGEVAAAERLGERLPMWVEARSGVPLTLVHGDFRVDNLMVGAPAGHSLDEGDGVVVVDWQTVGHGPALADVAYFLGASLPTEVRRAAEADLLEHYRSALARAGVDHPRERCRLDYRRESWAGVVMTVVASQIVGGTERGDEMFMTMARRHLAHVADAGALEFID
jgi:hypothetical protein